MLGKIATGLTGSMIAAHGIGSVANIGMDTLEYAALGTNDLDYATVGADMRPFDIMSYPGSSLMSKGPFSPGQNRFLFDKRTQGMDINRQAAKYSFSSRTNYTSSGSGMNRNMPRFINDGRTRPSFVSQQERFGDRGFPTADGSMVFGMFNNRFGA